MVLVHDHGILGPCQIHTCETFLENTEYKVWMNCAILLEQSFLTVYSTLSLDSVLPMIIMMMSAVFTT